VTDHSHMGPARAWALSVFLLLMAVLAACAEIGEQGEEPGPGGGPVIEQFTASPEVIEAGGSVTLNWDVKGAEDGDITLEGRTASGSSVLLQSAPPSSSYEAHEVVDPTTFTLNVNGGNSTRSVSVDVVDPTEPPSINAFAANASNVNWGDSVELVWETENASSVHLEPLGSVGAKGSRTVDHIYVDTTFILTATNSKGEKETREVEVKVNSDGPAQILLVIAGQSNAAGSGTPLDSRESPIDEVKAWTGSGWKTATEPLHGGKNSHSFGVRLGKKIHESTNAHVFLVPVAAAGSEVKDWRPGQTHFEHAVTEARKAAGSLGINVDAVIWFQGESETKTPDQRSAFANRTRDVFNGFQSQLSGSPEIIYAQLSKRLWIGEDSRNVRGHNLAYQDIREKQRNMERESSSWRMVVTHDLPMSDVKHISASGQRELGDRIAQAFFGDVGPRITGHKKVDGSTVAVDIDRPVQGGGGTADGYFTVFAGSDKRTVTGVTVNPENRQQVLLTVEGEVPDSYELRYMPPDSTGLNNRSDNVIYSEAEGVRLPLPAFGPPVEPLIDNYPGGRLQ